jgi:hypothetical protein
MGVLREIISTIFVATLQTATDGLPTLFDMHCCSGLGAWDGLALMNLCTSFVSVPSSFQSQMTALGAWAALKT